MMASASPIVNAHPMGAMLAYLGVWVGLALLITLLAPRIARANRAHDARPASRTPGSDYIMREGDAFAGEPMPIGTMLRWDPEMQTHYPDGRAT
jgi:hypothetical protein